MQIAIVNMLTQTIIEKVDANSEQEAANNYVATLAKEYDLTPTEFCFRNPMIVASLRAITIQ